MNINTIESFLDKEFKDMIPLTIIDNDVIYYQNFKISINDAGHWDLSRKNGDNIHTFKLKSIAIMAANYYSNLRYKQLEELKVLDFEYWSNAVDASFFKHRISETIDSITKDILLSRLTHATDRKRQLKKEIIKRLKVDF